MDNLPIIIDKVEEISPRSKHRFLTMIISSVVLSFILVVVGMLVYYSSGSYQLDLSRPGYVSVRSQTVTNDSDFANYSSIGSIDSASISEFKLLFSRQATKTKEANAFGGSPLSFDSLGLNIPATE